MKSSRSSFLDQESSSCLLQPMVAIPSHRHLFYTVQQLSSKASVWSCGSLIRNLPPTLVPDCSAPVTSAMHLGCPWQQCPPRDTPFSIPNQSCLATFPAIFTPSPIHSLKITHTDLTLTPSNLSSIQSGRKHKTPGWCIYISISYIANVPSSVSTSRCLTLKRGCWWQVAGLLWLLPHDSLLLGF